MQFYSEGFRFQNGGSSSHPLFHSTTWFLLGQGCILEHYFKKMLTMPQDKVPKTTLGHIYPYRSNFNVMAQRCHRLKLNHMETFC